MDSYVFAEYSHFCSISFISSGGIFNLSICSLTTLAHFCKESSAVQGLDMSTTNIIRVSFRELASIANFRRPLWYRSPSKIHTLHLVWSTKNEKHLLRLETVHYGTAIKSSLHVKNTRKQADYIFLQSTEGIQHIANCSLWRQAPPLQKLDV